MNIGDESQMCPTCEELEWQCQCPPEPDEIVNPTPDDYYDDPRASSVLDGPDGNGLYPWMDYTPVSYLDRYGA